MKKIKTNSLFSNLFCFFVFLTSYAVCIYFFEELYSKILLVLVTIVATIFFNFYRNKYIKDIIIEDDYIELRYKKNNQFFKICETEKIPKSDIRNFNVSIEKKEVNLYRAKYIYNTTIKIYRTNIQAIIIDINTRVGSPYYTFLECLKYSKNIPNFSFETKGLHSFEKEEIDYILKTGKRKINFIFLGIIIFLVILLTLEFSLLFLTNL